MIVIIDTNELCVAAFYSRDILYLRKKYSCIPENNRSLFRAAVMELKGELYSTKFYKLNQYNKEKYSYIFKKFDNIEIFGDILVVAVYAENRDSLFVDEALFFRDKALDMYDKYYIIYYTYSFNDIVKFVKTFRR